MIPLRTTFALLALVVLISCDDEMMNGDNQDPSDSNDLTDIPYRPEDYTLSYPSSFPMMQTPADNPLTVEGVNLGRHLFYDPLLSKDNSQSCSSCHFPLGNFTDNLAVSTGVDGIAGKRSSMPLLNVGFVNTGMFWDGHVLTLEEQALVPVENPIELHEKWPNVVTKLQQIEQYPPMFRKAFGIEKVEEISKELAAKALAQFERSLVSSGSSKYDRFIEGKEVFTDAELRGYNIFFDIDPDVSKHLECGHCHNAPLFTTNEFLNNGIEDVPDLESFDDKGRGIVTDRIIDNGAFRVPTLRNISFSAPYMHDGRFATIDEVIDHYVSGGHNVDNISGIMRPLELSMEDRDALKAFLKTLDDLEFMENPAFQNPFE